MNKELPLVPYGRKSSKEDPVISKDRQVSATQGWSARTGTPLLPFIWEPHVSGSVDWRKRELGEAIQLCLDGKAGGIVVEEQNRLSREKLAATAEVYDALQGALAHLARSGGFRLVCIQDGLDTATGDQELNFSIRAAIAREQWKQYERRIDHAKRNAVMERGVHICGKVPFGYRRPGKGKPLVTDKTEARLVKRAFQIRASKDRTLGDVLRYLEEQTGRAWAKTTVKKMLSNRAYLGEARASDKYVNPNGHKAIVSKGVFDVVQAKFKSDPTHGRSDAKYLLSGIARCGTCGYAMRRSRVNGKYFVYRCQSSAMRCSAHASIMAATIEEHVIARWQERVEQWGLEASEEPVADDGLEELLVALEVARNKMAPFEDPEYVDMIGLEAAKRGVQAARANVERLEDELASKVSSNGHPTARPDSTEMLRLFEEGNTAEQRELLEGSIEAVTISRAPRGALVTDPARVHIHWVGDGTAPTRPSRGRPRKADASEVEAGVATA